MLLSKPLDKTKVYTLKTTAGEEIISRISEEDETTYTLNKPMVFTMTPQGGFGLVPAIFSSRANSIVLNKSAVAMYGPTEQELASQYLEKTTGLTVATSL